MSFTEAEKELWHAARRAGLNPGDFDPDDLAAELESLKVSDEDDEGVAALVGCSHCGCRLGGASAAEFPLCDSCGG